MRWSSSWEGYVDTFACKWAIVGLWQVLERLGFGLMAQLDFRAGLHVGRVVHEGDVLWPGREREKKRGGERKGGGFRCMKKMEVAGRQDAKSTDWL